MTLIPIDTDFTEALLAYAKKLKGMTPEKIDRLHTRLVADRVIQRCCGEHDKPYKHLDALLREELGLTLQFLPANQMKPGRDKGTSIVSRAGFLYKLVAVEFEEEEESDG